MLVVTVVFLFVLRFVHFENKIKNLASRSQLVKDRNKDRSRSKSPFRSFRWKKSPQKSPLSAVASVSDDEAIVERTSGTSGTVITHHTHTHARLKSSPSVLIVTILFSQLVFIYFFKREMYI